VIIAHAVAPAVRATGWRPLPVIDLLRRNAGERQGGSPAKPRQLQEELDGQYKLAAKFSPSPGQIAPASAPVAHRLLLLPIQSDAATALPAVASPSFDHYFGIQIVSLAGGRTGWLKKSAKNFGRLFRATEEKGPSPERQRNCF